MTGTLLSRLARTLTSASALLVGGHGLFLQDQPLQSNTTTAEAVGILLPIGFVFILLAYLTVNTVLYPEIKKGVILKVAAAVFNIIAGILVLCSVVVWRVGCHRYVNNKHSFYSMMYALPPTGLLISVLLSWGAACCLFADLLPSSRRYAIDKQSKQSKPARPEADPNMAVAWSPGYQSGQTQPKRRVPSSRQRRSLSGRKYIASQIVK